MSQNIRRAIKKRNMIYRKTKKSKRQCDMDKCRLLRNTVVKQSKRSYFKGLRRCGTIWKAIKYLRDNTQIPDLRMGSMEALTGAGNATMLNERISMHPSQFSVSLQPTLFRG